MMITQSADNSLVEFLNLLFYNILRKSKEGTKFIFFLIFLFCNFEVYAQFDYKGGSFNASASAATLVKSITTPVNLYTGVPKIVEELHELKGRKYSIPLSLSYNASGIKVQDIASSIGLGWSLSSDCRITRVIKGRPDEDSLGYFGSDMGQRIEGTLSVAEMSAISSNEMDAEPDVFYFNIHGATGKFVFDKDKNPMMLENSSFKILNSPFKQELGLMSWVLCDDKGNRFYFGGNIQTIETTKSTFDWDDGVQVMEYNSSWYMEKIETADKLETINFNYTSGTSTKIVHYNKKMRMRNRIVTTIYREVKRFWIRLQKASASEEIYVIDQLEWDSNTVEEVLNPKYLISIITANERAYFNYSTNPRSDLEDGKRLIEITIHNYLDQRLHSYNFNHTYQAAIDFEPTENIRIYDKFRLQLSSVSVSTSLGGSYSLYRFSYNALILPPRQSSKCDAWGYYNNNNNGYFPVEDSLIIASKDVDVNRSKAGILERITYEKGAWKQLDYENNEIEENGGNKIVGGLRIKMIIETAGEDTPPKVTKYTYKYDNGYSTGKKLRPSPIFETYIDVPTIQESYPIGTIVPSPQQIIILPGGSRPPIPYVDVFGNYPTFDYSPQQPKSIFAAGLETIIGEIQNVYHELQPMHYTRYSPFIISSSSAYNELSDLENCAIGYSQVTVENAGNGRSVNVFTDVTEYPDEVTQLRVDSGFKTLVILYPNIRPFTPFTSYSMARGLLKESRIYDNENKLVSKITNTYQFGDFKKSVLGLRSALGKVNWTSASGTWSDYNQYYHIGYYYYNSFSLKSIKSTEFIDMVTTASELFYQEQYPFLLKKKIFNGSDQTLVTEEYKYVSDKDDVSYDGSYQIDAVNRLFNDGRMGILLETTKKKDSTIIDMKKIAYKTFSKTNGSLTKDITKAETIYGEYDNPARVTIRYEDYDFFGNLLCMTQPGVSICSRWGYNNLYVIAETSNAGPNEIYFQNFEEETGPGIISGQGHSGSKFFLGDFSLTYVNPSSKAYKLAYWYRESGIWRFSGYLPYNGPIIITDGDAIDDVVIIPKESKITSYSYDLLHGINSITSSRGETIYNEYDQFHRITTIKNKDGDILRHFKYNLNQNSVPANVYFNQEVKGVFYKQCYQAPGSPVTYIIPEGKYYSYSSQSTANTQAQNELISKGQHFANQQGNCGVYAKLVFNNPRWIYHDTYNKMIADVQLRFFSDINGTITTLTSQTFDIRTKVSYLWSNGINDMDSYSYWNFFTVPLGVSSLNLGTWEINGYKNYYDPWYQNNFEEGFSYEYIIDPIDANFYLPIN